MHLASRVHCDAHLRLAMALEAHNAVDLREQGPVSTDADIVAGVELGADLAHEDRTGLHVLAREALHAAHLRVGVATVASRALSFFVSHDAYASIPVIL